MASNTDLDELLDGALDDFRDAPTGLARPADESAAASPAQPPAASPAGAGLRFDPLASSKTPPKAGKASGKGPTLPPRPQSRGKGPAAAVPGAEQHRQAAEQQRSRSAGGARDSSGAPDLAATLQALAQSGPGLGAAGGGAGASQDLQATLRAAAAAATASGGAPGGAEEDKLLAELAEHLQGLGGDASSPQDMNSFVSGIMKQLLSKQVLHQSMKDIGDRYPEWLAAHRDSLAAEDLARYTQQHAHIRDICALYEDDPDNFDAIYNKLQQMQACGTPPDDIVQELSPGLAFDAEGLPQLPGGAGHPGCCVQ